MSCVSSLESGWKLYEHPDHQQKNKEFRNLAKIKSSNIKSRNFGKPCLQGVLVFTAQSGLTV